jgi:class 3 adenylate cyclase
VLIPEWASHIEAFWEEPRSARQLRRLASFSRLIMFDRRGVGLSDPVVGDHLPTLEETMDDVRAVMDAAGSDRAALMGVSEGGPIQALFAAAHPERTRALVLVNSYARLARAPDYPAGMPERMQQPFLDGLGAIWGSGATVDMLAPSLSGDAEFRAWFAKTERACASPGTAVAMFRHMFNTDVRAILPTLSVPTLVVHRSGDRMVRVGHGRFLAENIPGALYRELPGDDHAYAGDDVIDEVQEFLTGARSMPAVDRVLATVLLTDIVGSTDRATAIGDREWRELLDRHDAIVHRQLERHRGRLVKSTGDGALATFDGPARAISCALELRDALRAIGLDVRAGIHTGEIELRGSDVAGVAVHTAARVSALAVAGEVLVSKIVTDLVTGSGIRFEDRGEHELKGIPGEWRLFTVLD